MENTEILARACVLRYRFIPVSVIENEQPIKYRSINDSVRFTLISLILYKSTS